MSDKDKALIDAIAQDVSTFFLDENAEYNLETLPRIIALHVSPALATARKEVWREAILIVDTAPLCFCAGKQYVDPVALVQRMNDALERAENGGESNA